MPKVTALGLPVGGSPEKIKISDDLIELQQYVNGYVLPIHLEGDFHIYYNEDGIPLRLPYNRTITGQAVTQPFLGNFAIVKRNGKGQFKELKDSEIEYLIEKYNLK